MRLSFDPFRLLLIALAGMMSQQYRDVIDYLQEENRVLRQQIGNKSATHAASSETPPSGRQAGRTTIAVSEAGRRE